MYFIIMKIITLHTRIDPTELRNHIRLNLDRLFRQQRDITLHFRIGGEGNVIDIMQPETYGSDILFHIEVDGINLNITRSEHYTDDVNSLTVESILNELFKEVAGKSGTDLLQEG